MAQTIKELKEQVKKLNKELNIEGSKLDKKQRALEDECNKATRDIDNKYDKLFAAVETETNDLYDESDNKIQKIEWQIEDLQIAKEEAAEEKRAAKQEVKRAKAADKLRRAVSDSPTSDKLDKLIKAAKAAGLDDGEINKTLLVAVSSTMLDKLRK